MQNYCTEKCIPEDFSLVKEMKKEFTQWCSLVRENQQIKAGVPPFLWLQTLQFWRKWRLYKRKCKGEKMLMLK